MRMKELRSGSISQFRAFSLAAERREAPARGVEAAAPIPGGHPEHHHPAKVNVSGVTATAHSPPPPATNLVNRLKVLSFHGFVF